MPSKLWLLGHIAEGNPTSIEVVEDFDKCLDHVVPLSQPSSALEARHTALYTDPEGNRLYIPPHLVGVIEEL